MTVNISVLKIRNNSKFFDKTQQNLTDYSQKWSYWHYDRKPKWDENQFDFNNQTDMFGMF